MRKIFKLQLSNQEETNPKKVHRINLRKYQEFINEYKSIFFEDEIIVLIEGGDPSLFPEDLLYLLKNRSKIHYILVPRLHYELNTEIRQCLEKFSEVYIPFNNNHPTKNSLDIFLDNIKSITHKENIIALIDLEEFSSFEACLRFLSFLKNMGYSKVEFSKPLDSSQEFKVLGIGLNISKNLFDIRQNLNYKIDFDGKIYNLKNINKQSTIFKNVAYLVF